MATNNGIISGAMAQNQPDYTAQAKQLYQQNFGRDGDQEGINYWAGQLASGKSADDVSAAFKDAAKGTYQNYLTNPDANSQTLSQDLQSGVTPGAIGGSSAQELIKNGVNPNIYSNLYGNEPPPQQMAQPKQGGTQQQNYTASTYTASQLSNPTQWNVTPDQTSAGLVNQYTDPNSPIIQAAMTRAKEQQNANGTLNSSMAETAGQLAAYNAAIPLAQQDAQTYSKAAGYNADEVNQFAVQNATFKNQAGQFNANARNTLTGQKLAADTNITTANIGAETQKFLGTLSSQTQQAIAGMDNQSKMALAQLDSGTKTQLEQLDNQNKQLLQTNSSAANMFAAYMQQIGNISSSTTMDQAAKDTATQNAIANLNQGLQVLQGVSNIDLSKYFMPGTFTPTTQPAQPATPDSTANNIPNFNMLMNEGSTGG
jgi:hypothetical protein